MKDIMALLQYRLKEAEESLKEAEVLLRGGMSMRAVMNRMYYAMFYALLALLQQKQIVTSKHSGAISLFDKELSKTLHRAFELTQKGDYIEEAEVTKKLIRCNGNRLDQNCEADFECFAYESKQ
ncbi:MAG: HEPN domain-containing protein [Candidatus Scalindua sp.]|nr:HEPN domain-containing protein [Candidatus Scalindua sp.]